MTSMQASPEATVSVRNVGGIEETEVTFRPGVTVLEGRNATNRTSLLRSLAAALGSDQATLKGDAADGEVSLQLGETTYTRTFGRSGRTVEVGGDPYLDDAQSADLFAFLFGSNEARRAVEGGEDLREIIMRPVDTDALQAEIRRLQDERDEVAAQIDELDALADRRPELAERMRSVEAEVAETEAELEAAREALDSLEADPERQQERQAELDERMSELTERRSELERVEARIAAEEESLDSLREEREEVAAELEDLPAASDSEIDRVETDLSRRRERKRDLDATVSRLDAIVEFNRETLSGDAPDVLDRLDGGDGDVTDDLLADEARSVVCWTCGSEVERGAIEGTLDRLRDLRSDLVADREEVTAEIESLKRDAERLRDRRDRREQAERRLDRIESEIADRESTRADLAERRGDLESEVAELTDAVESLRDEADDGEVLERQREVSELEYDLAAAEEDLAEVEAELQRVEERLSERSALEERYEELSEQIVDCRTRVETLETEAVDAFNEHMAELIDLLGYDNVERVWIEPREVERREGRRTVTRRAFDLHVVRTGEGGTAYEDTVETLSESEREVVGLVFALAGYLAHDLGESVPFVLLDSLEAIDADRIADLVDYFADHADYLVVALLPEDAAAVDADHRVTEV